MLVAAVGSKRSLLVMVVRGRIFRVVRLLWGVRLADCYHPWTAYQMDDGSIAFVERVGVKAVLTLPCGQCVGCRLERSRQWAARCMHESQMHEKNAFVTLTYDDAHLPDNGSLEYRDFQLFMKRLRKFSGVPVRFYMCGEYGEANDRPHYHAILFGYDFDDKSPWSTTAQGHKLYRSATLDKLWPLGHCLIGDVTFESAGYVARYIMKKVTGDLGEKEYTRVDLNTGEIFRRVPPFNHMSLKPGVGAEWLKKYNSDIFPDGTMVVNGVKCSPPKYYLKKFAEENPLGAEDLALRRFRKGVARFADSSDARLAVKEEVTMRAITNLVRSV